LTSGDSVLDVDVTSSVGEKGSIKIRYHLADDETLVVTVELLQPITIKMIRLKEETKP